MFCKASLIFALCAVVSASSKDFVARRHGHIRRVHNVTRTLQSRSNCPGMSPLVQGCPVGFGAGVRGGGTANPVYPKSNQELAKYLADPNPQVIVLTRTFDFRGTEGPAFKDGCAPWTTAPGCQVAINAQGTRWCDTEQPKAPKLKNIKVDAAGLNPLQVLSRKTILGQGNDGVIRGKGLHLQSVDNIIIQNILITEVNPQAVWGGDGIDLSGASHIWIDHVTISQMGRQLFVAHKGKNTNVTISNVHFDGKTPYSSFCNGQHYWGAKFEGDDDTITFMENHFSNFLGRAPQVGGDNSKILMHLVNNVWEGNSKFAHAVEVLKGGVVLAEGNFFADTPQVVDPTNGLYSLYTADTESKAEACHSVLGRTCSLNLLKDSSKFDYATGSVLADQAWRSLNIVPQAAMAAKIRGEVISNAGVGGSSAKPVPAYNASGSGSVAASSPDPDHATAPHQTSTSSASSSSKGPKKGKGDHKKSKQGKVKGHHKKPKKESKSI
ncbi:hypothetical protein OC845_000487 [Tilletia horrida]|nr:hypothetical protein OC845_000487 [Tilletia horrida]